MEKKKSYGVLIVGAILPVSYTHLQTILGDPSVFILFFHKYPCSPFDLLQHFSILII